MPGRKGGGGGKAGGKRGAGVKSVKRTGDKASGGRPARRTATNETQVKDTNQQTNDGSVVQPSGSE